MLSKCAPLKKRAVLLVDEIIAQLLLVNLNLPVSEEENSIFISGNILEQTGDFEEWLDKNGVRYIITNEQLDENMLSSKPDPFLNQLNCDSPENLNDYTTFKITDFSIEDSEESSQDSKKSWDKNSNAVSKKSTKECSNKCISLEKHCESGICVEIMQDVEKLKVLLNDVNGEEIIPSHYLSPDELGCQIDHPHIRQSVTSLEKIPLSAELEITMPKLQTEQGLRLYLCPLSDCQHAFVRLATGKLHGLVHLQHKPFKCDFPDCSWAFYTPTKLKRHQETHFKRKEFVCTEADCARKFTTIYNLNCHKRLHQRPADLPCPVKSCGEMFQTTRARQLHLKSHRRSEATHKCPVPKCTKKFFTVAALHSHTRSHSHNEDELTCHWPNCGKVFEQPYRLKEHVRVHTGLKPYCCSFEDCKWSFTTASKLKRHQITHTNERKFHCTIGNCSKSFLRSEHLREHTLTHIGQRTYVCEVCNADFMGKSSLYLHMKKVHPEQSKPACARVKPYTQDAEKLSPEALLEQAIQSLGVPSDMIIGTGLIPEEPLGLLEHENFSTVNLNDLQ